MEWNQNKHRVSYNNSLSVMSATTYNDFQAILLIELPL